MALTINLTLFFCFISFIISCSSQTLNWWCHQTPHYETCNHYMAVAGLHPATTTITANQFLDMTVQAALHEAHVAIKQILNIASAAANVPGKSSWGSCVDYFDQIVSTLNMVLDHDPDRDCDHELDVQRTPLDVQTWLSAGLTYITICHKGFELINMTNPVLPLISNNLTQLILNSLSISTQVGNITRSHVINEPVGLNISDEYKLDELADQRPDAVVARDGSGNFRTIQEAVNSAVNRRPNKRYVIYVKAGVYKEYVEVPRAFRYIMMYGDGIGKTVITGDRHCGGDMLNSSKAGDLQGSATFKVWSHGFIARDITFQNTAGPEGGQALALLSSSDKSAFYRCSFEGYQDTLLTVAFKQFYKECQIYGTLDFIFGGALAVFQDCNIFLRKPLWGGGLIVTAHGRNSDYEPTGYSFQGCTVTAAADLRRYNKAFLGRPWFGLSRTVYMQSFLGDWVDPKGWVDSWKHWKTAYCGEYMNYGPGSSTDKRVTWPHYHAIKDRKTARNFTVRKFIEGNHWLPQTRVPFTPGFIKRPVLLK